MLPNVKHITGVVLDEEEKPLAEARIDHAADPRLIHTTDSEGRFVIDTKAPIIVVRKAGYHYRRAEFKRTSLPAPKDGHFWLKSGDLLITRSNTPELVGHSAIYDGTPSPCIFPDLMMRLALNVSAVDLRFVWYWLQSPLVRDFIGRKAKGTSPTMKKISQGIVMEIPFPSTLPIPEQRRIVAELDAMQTQLDALKDLQAQTGTELDALLPLILSKAFQGQLFQMSAEDVSKRQDQQ
jgi:type I restriction enzyme S subunit